MSGHRKMIRDVASAALRANAAFAAMGHEKNQRRDLSDDRLPFWSHYTRMQRSVELDKETQRNDTELVVLIRRAGGDDLDDELDADADLAAALLQAAFNQHDDIFFASTAQLKFSFDSEGGTRKGTAEVSITLTTHHEILGL